MQAAKKLNAGASLGGMVRGARGRNARKEPTLLDATLLRLIGEKVKGEVRKPVEPREGSAAAKALQAMRRGPVSVGKVLTLPLHGTLNRNLAQPVVPVATGKGLAYTVPGTPRQLQAMLRQQLSAAGWL